MPIQTIEIVMIPSMLKDVFQELTQWINNPHGGETFSIVSKGARVIFVKKEEAKSDGRHN